MPPRPSEGPRDPAAPASTADPVRAVLGAAPEAIGIAKGLKGFLLWVGGSLAGITAVFYACGYLVTRAHMSMLGLYGFVNFDGDHFLQEGAKFLLAIGKELAEILTVVSALLGFLLLVPAALALAFPRRGAALVGRFRNWRSRGDTRQTLERIRGLLYGAAFAALIAVTGYSLDRLYAPLEVANLLYAPTVGSGCAAFMDTDPVCLRQALLRGDSEQLGFAFGTQFSLTGSIALLACITWWIVMPWRWRGWLIAPFIVSVSLALLMLPMDYGVLQRPTIYPVVQLAVESKGAAAPTRLFLINKSDGDFVVWDEAARKVAWIPAGSVARADIVEVRDLFAARAPGPQGAVQ